MKGVDCEWRMGGLNWGGWGMGLLEIGKMEFWILVVRYLVRGRKNKSMSIFFGFGSCCWKGRIRGRGCGFFCRNGGFGLRGGMGVVERVDK